MYRFHAYYEDLNGYERMECIEIEEQFFDTEAEIYVHAMSKAYVLKEDFETLSKVEFICC